MKTEDENLKSMDELVFENRNKDYGAYVLRKEYDNHVQRAFNLVCVAGAGIVMLLSFLSDDPVIKMPKVPDGTILKFDPQPEILAPAKPAAKPPKGISKSLAPKVTTTIPPQETLPAEDAIEGVEDGAVTDDVALTTSSVGNVPVDVPVTDVVEPREPRNWAEVMPEYKGGVEAMMKFMQKKIKYPPIARRINIQGTVFVSFIVDTDGKVIGAKVLKGISKECDDEAVRVIASMPEWNAGRMGNIPVMVRMVLPIKFQIQE